MNCISTNSVAGNFEEKLNSISLSDFNLVEIYCYVICSLSRGARAKHEHSSIMKVIRLEYFGIRVASKMLFLTITIQLGINLNFCFSHLPAVFEISSSFH